MLRTKNCYVIIAVVLLGSVLSTSIFAIRHLKNFNKNKYFSRSGYIKDIKIFQGKIYFATANGISVLNVKSKKWSNINMKNSNLPDNFVAKIAIDEREQTIWFATASGVARYKPSEKNILRRWTIYNKNNGLADNDTTAIAIDADYVWVGTRYWGVCRFNKRLSRWRKKTYTPIDGLGANRINDLSVMGDSVWAATAEGLSLYDRYTDFWSNFDVKQGLSAQQVTCIDADGGGVWAGTYGGGLNYFSKEDYKFKVYKTKNGLIDDTIFSVRNDGNFVWVATFSGISRFTKTEGKDQWLTLKKSNYKLVDNMIVAMAIQGNKIWLGSDGEGATLLDKINPFVEITGQTKYLKPGEISIRANINDATAIKNYTIQFRSSIFTTQKPSVEGIKLKNRSSVSGEEIVKNVEIARWNVTKLKENFTYDIILNVFNGKGKRNSVTYPMIVDKTIPILNLNILPEAVKVDNIFLRGSYIELYLNNILFSINGSKFKPVDEVNRKIKSFKQKIILKRGVNEIEVMIEDLAKHRVIVRRKVFLDLDKPIIIFQNKKTEFISAIPDFVIKGKIDDPFLFSVNLKQGNKKITFTKSHDKFIFKHKVSLKKGNNIFDIVAVDSVGNRSVKSLKVIYNTEAPEISFSNNLPTKTADDYLTVHGKWNDSDLREIYISPGNVTAEINRKEKTFKARIKLKKGFNIVKAVAIDLEDNKKEVETQIILDKTIKTKKENGLSASENYKLYLEYKRKYDNLLYKYKNLLLRYESLKYALQNDRSDVLHANLGGGKLFIPGGNSLFFVRYDRSRGDKLESLAKKYTGNKIAKGFISRLNSGVSGSLINKRKKLLMPTKSLIRHSLTTTSRETSFLIIDSIAKLYSGIGPGHSAFAVRNYIVRNIKKYSLIKRDDSNKGKSLFQVAGKVMLLVSYKGSYGYRMNELVAGMGRSGIKIGYLVYVYKNHIRFVKRIIK